MNMNVRKICLLLWIFSCVYFGLNFTYVIFIKKQLYNTVPSFYALSLFVAILIGFFSFLGLLASFFSSGKKPITEPKPEPKKRKTSWGVVIGIVVILLGVLTPYVPKVLAAHYIDEGKTYQNAGQPVSALASYEKAKSLMKWDSAGVIESEVVNTLIASAELQKENMLNPKPIPTNTPTQVKPTYVPKAVVQVDSDPPVHCQIHANCGGGTIPLKQSECKNSICCCDKNGKCSLVRGQTTCTSQTTNSGQTTTQNTTQQNTNLVQCTITWSYSNKTETYLLTPESCAHYQESSKASNSQPIITPYIPPTQTTSSAEDIQRCIDSAQRTFDSAKTDCSYKARAYGLTSSSWYNSCVTTAQNDFIYAQSFCK
jgi:hypothetical protein